MSSAKPTDHDISTEHFAGIMDFQAKDWLSAEPTAQPLASQSMASQGGTLGRTISTLPRARQASETVFGLTEGDSSVESATRSRAQISGGRYGTTKTSAEGASGLASVHLGSHPSIDLDLEVETLLDQVPIGMSGSENPGLDRAAQFELHGQSEDVSDLQSEADSSHSIEQKTRRICPIPYLARSIASFRSSPRWMYRARLRRRP
eukprot:6052098-Pyramimonas_sp.AAC.1